MTVAHRFHAALLVEDEPNLAQALKIALRKLGIPVEHASTLHEASVRIAAQMPDFILLDRNLPDGDGLTLCRELREQGFQGSILVLTARGEITDRVQGLSVGADDYLPKPFSWEELNARIEALARRQLKLNATPVVPPTTNLPTTSPELWHRDDERLGIFGVRGWITLTPLEFKLASRLIDAGGRIVSRDDLLKDVWGFTLLPKTRTVDHFLGRLRRHFETNAEEPRHFLTVRGAGYRFEK